MLFIIFTEIQEPLLILSKYNYVLHIGKFPLKENPKNKLKHLPHISDNRSIDIAFGSEALLQIFLFQWLLG